ncbi:MAG TPA: ABC transporter substrate-binding protein [Stellaceae bacterium]|nr:ABC transporter substrate-binding protein [Stellaceae bacterium]
MRARVLRCILGVLPTLLCGAAAPAGAEPLKLRMSWTITPSELTPILFAPPGIARHEGSSYVVEPIHFGGGPLSVPAMAKGEIDIGGFGYATLAAAIQGAHIDDLMVIGDVAQDGVPGWYSLSYFVLKDGPIHAIADLRSKTVGVNTIGSLTDLGQRQMLRQHGLDDRKDVTIIEVAPPNLKATLAAHKIDMMGAVAPIAADPELRAIARPLFTAADAIGVTQISALIARESFIQAHRAALVDFFEDAIRATHWYLDPAHHAEAVKIAADFNKQPVAAADWAFTRQDQYRSPDMLPNLDALQRNVDLLWKLDFIKARLDIGEHADLSLVRAADARLR